MTKLNIIRTGYVVGVMSVAFYLVCIGWGFVLTSPELKDLHFQLLQMTYPGFSFAFTGLLIGLGEAFGYGLFFGSLFAWLCRKVCIDENP